MTSSDKEQLRRELRNRRGSLAPEERRRLSLAAAHGVVESALWQRAETVALYVAVRGETDTGALLADAWKTGKTTLLPACSATEAGKMCFALCSGPRSLRPGPYSIPGPALSDEEIDFHLAADSGGNIGGEPGNGRVPPSPDLIIVPGLAFDRNGIRLGTGGGYYDRLLALPRYRDSLRLGLAYSFQIVDRLPREDWDQPVHAVCTEQGILWIHDMQPFPAG